MAPWSAGRNGKYTIHIVTFCPKLCIKLYDSSLHILSYEEMRKVITIANLVQPKRKGEMTRNLPQFSNKFSNVFLNALNVIKYQYSF